MFYEEFELYPDDDDPRAEYITDDLKITYYMPHITDGENDFIRTVIHEWIHGLIDWATEGDTKSGADEDHFILRQILFD